MNTITEFSSVKKKEVLNVEGTAASLLFITTLPKSSVPCSLCKFYGNIASACKNFCQKELLPIITGKSQAEGISIEWIYRLTVSPSISTDGILVTMSVCLTDRTRRRTIDKCSFTHVWDSAGNKIIKKQPNIKKQRNLS